MKRCDWVGDDPLTVRYHDEEWGTPTRDDRKLFEFLVLDMFQAGLSWRTVLHKRPAFDQVFHHFEAGEVATFGDNDLTRLMNNAGIIRNKAKINATISNATLVPEVQSEFGSLAAYLWQFTGGTTLDHAYELTSEIGAVSPEAEAMSRDLRARGFRFTGPVVCYAFMQGSGMINDHLVSCFRYQQLASRK